MRSAWQWANPGFQAQRAYRSHHRDERFGIELHLGANLLGDVVAREYADRIDLLGQHPPQQPSNTSDH